MQYDDEKTAAPAVAWGRGWELTYAGRAVRGLQAAERAAWERMDAAPTDETRAAWDSARAKLAEAEQKERQAEKVARRAWDWAAAVQVAAA